MLAMCGMTLCVKPMPPLTPIEPETGLRSALPERLNPVSIGSMKLVCQDQRLFMYPRDSPSRAFFSADPTAFAVVVINGSLSGFPIHLDGDIRTVVVAP